MSGAKNPVGRPRVDSLTDTQRGILERVIGGLSLTETAIDMGLSLKTVSFHVREAARKLGAATTIQAAVWYDRGGRMMMPGAAEAIKKAEMEERKRG